MSGITWGSNEDGGFGPRGGGTRIAHVSGKQFSVDSGGFEGRVVVNLGRANVWRNERVVIALCTGDECIGWRRGGGGKEITGRRISDKELDEGTGEEGDKDLDQGELMPSGRGHAFVRGEQRLTFAFVEDVVIVGIRHRPDVARTSGIHTWRSRGKRCYRSTTASKPAKFLRGRVGEICKYFYYPCTRARYLPEYCETGGG